jgi:hypothetical protein
MPAPTATGAFPECTAPSSFEAAYCVDHCPPKPLGLRDQFAMAALGGLLANEAALGSLIGQRAADLHPMLAETAFIMADAMMARRRKA